MHNTVILQNTELPGRGELLPYIYYSNFKWFDVAVILHDSVFINALIDTSVDKYKILWDFEHNWDQIEDETRIINVLGDKELTSFYENKSLWKGCFGGMSIIEHSYLKHIHDKYDLNKLIPLITTRYNRCSFERVIACLLQKETGNQPSLFGNIHSYCRWGIKYHEIELYKYLPAIKCWSGR